MAGYLCTHKVMRVAGYLHELTSVTRTHTLYATHRARVHARFGGSMKYTQQQTRKHTNLIGRNIFTKHTNLRQNNLYPYQPQTERLRRNIPHSGTYSLQERKKTRHLINDFPRSQISRSNTIHHEYLICYHSQISNDTRLLPVENIYEVSLTLSSAHLTEGRRTE